MPIQLRTRKGREIDQHPRHEADKPERYRPGRLCPCGQTLSVYNPGPSCWVHAPERYVFVDSLGELRELMEA